MSDKQKTLTVAEDYWLLRLYAKTWDTDPRSADLCRLFWGTLFCWVPYLFVGVIYLFWPIWKPLVLLHEMMERRRAYRVMELIDDEEPPPPQESKRSKWLDRIIDFFTRVRQWRLWEYAGWLLVGVVGLCALFMVGILLYLLTRALLTLELWIFLVAIGGAFLIAMALWAGLMIERKWPGTLLKPVKKTKSGGAGFFKIMGAGIHAFKERTCPRIIVEPKRVK